jgi:imidazole glycerol-phosphate synthase subunit HisH
MIVLIDIETSNLRSVINAFDRVGATLTVSSDPRDVANANAIVLPGVGAFERGMAGLHKFGLVDALKRRVADEGIPLIGICLGMQLLAEVSYEHGTHEGLGLIKGEVKKLHPVEAGYPVPNIGWCDTLPKKQGVLFPDMATARSFYFVHGFQVECADQDNVAATINYGGQLVTAAIECDNIFGAQFHPEKSQDDGLDLLSRFVAHLRDQSL